MNQEKLFRCRQSFSERMPEDFASIAKERQVKDALSEALRQEATEGKPLIIEFSTSEFDDGWG